MRGVVITRLHAAVGLLTIGQTESAVGLLVAFLVPLAPLESWLSAL